MSFARLRIMWMLATRVASTNATPPDAQMPSGRELSPLSSILPSVPSTAFQFNFPAAGVSDRVEPCHAHVLL